MSLSVGTVLYENESHYNRKRKRREFESHYVHLIASQYECVVNCLWTARCLRVTVPLVLFAYLAAWELNFRGLSHLKWKKISGGGPPDPRLRLRTTPKEGGWYATAWAHSLQVRPKTSVHADVRTLTKDHEAQGKTSTRTLRGRLDLLWQRILVTQKLQIQPYGVLESWYSGFHFFYAKLCLIL